MKEVFHKRIAEPIWKAFRVGKKYLLEGAIDFVRGRPPRDLVTSIGSERSTSTSNFFPTLGITERLNLITAC
jgi:hypothetical protein